MLWEISISYHIFIFISPRDSGSVLATHTTPHHHSLNSLRVDSLFPFQDQQPPPPPPRSTVTAATAALLRQCKTPRRFSPEPSPPLPSPPAFDFCFRANPMSPFRSLLLSVVVFLLLWPLDATEGDADPLYMLVSLSLDIHFSIYS